MGTAGEGPVGGTCAACCKASAPHKGAGKRRRGGAPVPSSTLGVVVMGRPRLKPRECAPERATSSPHV